MAKSLVSNAVDAFPNETLADYCTRVESWLESQQCTAHESGGIRCEKSAAHTDPCACPQALARWLGSRRSVAATQVEMVHA